MLTEEVAALGRCSVHTVRRAAHNKELTAYRPGGGRSPLKFRREDVEKWLATPADDDWPRPEDQERRHRQFILDNPDLQPEFGLFCKPNEMLGAVPNPLTGGRIAVSDAMRETWQRYAAAYAEDESRSVAELRGISGYDARLRDAAEWGE